jgi:hypothetical protein
MIAFASSNLGNDACHGNLMFLAYPLQHKEAVNNAVMLYYENWNTAYQLKHALPQMLAFDDITMKWHARIWTSVHQATFSGVATTKTLNSTSYTDCNRIWHAGGSWWEYGRHH